MLKNLLSRWPVVRQIQNKDWKATGETAMSGHTHDLRARHVGAEVTRSVCPYCGVGCGQLIFHKDNELINIEGDPDSPISRGCLCPKGSATFQLVTGAHRVHHVLYRRPGGTDWETIPLEQAMNMVADQVRKTRDATWEDKRESGHPLRRTLGIAHLGGATLDNEENYLIKKLFTSLGIIQIENQARI